MGRHGHSSMAMRNSAIESLGRLRQKAGEISRGKPEVMEEQIARLGHLLEETEKDHWINEVTQLAACSSGRSELLQQGMIVAHEASSSALDRVAVYRLLRLRVRKRLIHRLDVAGLIVPAYGCHGERCRLPRAF